MATNEILRFSETDTGTNLLTQAEYLADAQRPIGNQPGVARSKLVNKALRQSSLIAAGVAEFLADNQANNITDETTPQNISDYLAAVIRSIGVPIAVAGGTADAITADFTPDVALTNGTNVIVRAGSANATTTPTFAPDGLTAKTIVKGNNLPLAAGDIAGAGHWLELNFDTVLDKWVLQNPAKGIATSTATDAIKSITCTRSGGALTFTLNPCVLDFRSTTLTTGVPVTRTVSAPITLTVPSGGTLGSVTTIAANLIPVAIDNAGTMELAVINIAGGNALDEKGVINTTAVSASSTSSTVFYSTTARTGVAYRVVGSVTAVNTTGAWDNPTLVQGYGGQALAAMSSLGYGQTYQNVTASRVFDTTYANTTGKPIYIIVSCGGGAGVRTVELVVNGVSYSIVYYNPTYSSTGVVQGVIQPGSTYRITTTGTPQLFNWSELR